MKPHHVFLIDGSGFIFRAFHALPPMTRPDGTPVNAVYGFVTMVMKLLEETDADHIAVIFDSERRTFRNDIYADYKANRPPPPDELIPQFDLVFQATRALNLPCIAQPGFEADDLIATYTRLAREQGADVTIVSSDKDLMQLVGTGVVMLDAMKNRVIGPDQVVERFGVGPDKVVDVQSLAGDSTDNVPGIPGIGVKTAAQLINEFGDLETLLARAAEIKQPKRRQSLLDGADTARLTRQLVLLKNDVPVEHPLDQLVVRDPDAKLLIDFLREQNFKSLLAKVESRLPAGATDGVHFAHGADGEPKPAETAAYELVQDTAALERWVVAAREAGIVAVDTETTSLDPMRAVLVGVSLSLVDGKACYIPLAHRPAGGQGTLDLAGPTDNGNGEAIRQIPLHEAVARLKPLLDDPAVLKVGHNIKYDMHILARHGMEVSPVEDSMVLSYVLDGGLHGHGMDELADQLLNYKTINFAEVAGSGKNMVTFDRVPLDKALDYAAEDADITGRLFRNLRPRLLAERMVTVHETLERPLIAVLERMERHGIKVDAVALKALSDDFNVRMGDLADEIYKLAGHEFNIGSPKQLGEVLFDEMGIGGGKKGKTGAYATGADVLEDLAAQGHDLPARVLDWRQLSKLKSTYTDTLCEQINPESGRIHTCYAQTVAATGRLSSNDPNLQNIPVRTEEGRKIRRAFIADDGHVLLSADYSQIELRLLAHVAGIDTLKDAFRDGLDIHAMTASQVFGVPIEGMDPMIRRKAKAINFGIIYGISAFGLARQLRIPRGEAARYIDAYFERYPGIKAYMERAVKDAREKGHVTTLFGRRIHARGINDRNPAMRSFAERAAINAPIQGGAADIIKRAMIRVPGALAAKNLQARMLLQVHDELVFEVPEAEVAETEAVVRAVMAGAAHLDVPLVVDTGRGVNWEEAH